MKIALLIGAALVVGCRADVEGEWSGHVGEDFARLELEQAGASVRGTICVEQSCAAITGRLVDERFEADFGCSSCRLLHTELDLDVFEDAMQGTAFIPSCECSTAACDCLFEVELGR